MSLSVSDLDRIKIVVVEAIEGQYHICSEKFRIYDEAREQVYKNKVSIVRIIAIASTVFGAVSLLSGLLWKLSE